MIAQPKWYAKGSFESLWRSIHVWTLCVLVPACLAQFPASVPSSNLTVVTSPINPNITISFKTPNAGTCTTVFATQKQYSGYITIPPTAWSGLSINYTINTFFWFFEARQLPETAPFTIFINGGPGSSSMVGLFQEVGPCQVVEVGPQQLGTVPRNWGWDRSSNIIFIDQPVQVGFSYDRLTNKSLNLLNGLYSAPPSEVPPAQPSYTYLNGTFSSGNPVYTVNTSQTAAQALWHFTQAFFATFPQYNPATRNSSTYTARGINLFTESYGGKYGPAIAKFFRQQNILRQSNAAFASVTLDLKISTLGIINGWVDLLVQAPLFPKFAYNNTYGIQAISQVQEINALTSFAEAGGCQQQAITCRAQQAGLDPNNNGYQQSVDDLCSSAQAVCQADVILPYTAFGRSIYDISQPLLDPFPNNLYLEYLNTDSVQQAIGVSLNFTQSSPAVEKAFNQTGDYVRGGILDDLTELLNAGTRVGLIYGDRDYICNWVSGEAVAYAIAQGAGLAYQSWANAGYVPIVTNDSYIGGVVRELGNLSFSRVYDAGHLVPAYQPETAFTIFSRLIQGTGVSLGRPVNLTVFASSGDSNSTHRNQFPAAASPTCYLRAVNSTCNTDQKNMLANHGGVIINGVLYSSAADWPGVPASVVSNAGYPGKTPPATMTANSSVTASMSTTDAASSTISSVPTGVFTATGIPSIATTNSRTKNAAATVMAKSNKWHRVVPVSGFVIMAGSWAATI